MCEFFRKRGWGWTGWGVAEAAGLCAGIGLAQGRGGAVEALEHDGGALEVEGIGGEGAGDAGEGAVEGGKVVEGAEADGGGARGEAAAGCAAGLVVVVAAEAGVAQGDGAAGCGVGLEAAESGVHDVPIRLRDTPFWGEGIISK